MIKWDRGRNCCLSPARYYYCCSVNFVNRNDRYYIIPRIDVLGSLQSKLAARIISIYLKQKRNRIIGNSWNAAAALSSFLVIRWRWAAISRKAYYYSCYYMRCSGFFSYYWSQDCLFFLLLLLLLLPNFAKGRNMSTAAENNQWLRSFKEIFFVFFFRERRNCNFTPELHFRDNNIPLVWSNHGNRCRFIFPAEKSIFGELCCYLVNSMNSQWQKYPNALIDR